MTPQELKAMKMALEALEYWDVHGKLHQPTEEAIAAIKEALKEHAMRETQRLGQEIEQCQCPECQIKPHASDCAVHSEPAYPKGKCDCGEQPEQEPVAHWSDCAVHSEPAYPKGECDCGGIVAVADYTALSDKYVALSDKYVALKAQHKEQEPVAHCKVRPLRGDESFPKVEIDWVNQPVPGPLYTSPPQRKPLTYCQECMRPNPIDGTDCAHGIKEIT